MDYIKNRMLTMMMKMITYLFEEQDYTGRTTQCIVNVKHYSPYIKSN